jgi:hypothetical protein
MSSPERGWILSVPFAVAPALHLKEETSEPLEGIQLKMRPAEFGYNRFLVEGLASIDHARDLFARLKAGALTAGLYAGCGVRIVDALLAVDDSTPLPSEPDRPMVYRHDQDLRRLVLHAGQPELHVARVLPRFMDGLRAGLTIESVSRAMQDPQVHLAGVLYTDSHFELSPQARFIGLIGVLEVLKDKGPCPPQPKNSSIDGWTSSSRADYRRSSR